MSNLGDFKRGLVTLANSVGGLATVNQAISVLSAPYQKTSADAMATTTTANVQTGFANHFGFSIKLVGAYVVPVGGTLTADDTNNAVITLKFDDGAAGTPAAAATWTTSTTGTGNWAVGVREAATLTAANCVLVDGGVVWFNIAKGGSGVVVPTSNYIMLFARAE
jgi:hypothetical protein